MITSNLSESDVNVLSTAMDRVVPAVDDLPGAGGMGLAIVVVERSRADEHFWNALTTVVNALSSAGSDGSGEFASMSGDEQDDALRAVETSEPAAFALWLDVVFTIYYMQPAVHKRLDWHGRSPQPVGNEMPPWDESVLSKIRQREPFWRKV